MRYVIIAFDTQTGESQTLIGTDDLESIRGAQSQVRVSPALLSTTPYTPAPGRPGRKVVVVCKAPDCTLPAEPGQIFSSTAVASAALKCNYNAVRHGLLSARVRGMKIAVIKGVTLAYLDDNQSLTPSPEPATLEKP